MVTIESRISQESGIPLGGIGTGTLELRPDGCFHEWQIFNLGTGLGDWAPRQPEFCKVSGPDMPPGALAFYVRTRAGDDAAEMRRLSMRQDQQDLYNYAWLKPVRGITFEGRFPHARLQYRDATLPVAVSSEFFSPFIPHDARTSGTPGFHGVFRFENLQDREVEVSLLGALRNPLAICAKDRKLQNSVTRCADATVLTMRTDAEAPCPATVGSLAMSLSGGDVSWVAGEFEGFMKGQFVWALSLRNDSVLREFLETGRLPSLPGDRSPAGELRLKDAEIAELPARKKESLIRRLRRWPCFDIYWRNLQAIDPSLVDGDEGQSAFLRAARAHIEVFAGHQRERQTWGDAALASTLTLAPREVREVCFTMGWHFPNHYSETGKILGHQYEHWFDDAEAVCRNLVENQDIHRRTVTGFAETLYDTSLPGAMPDAWSGQLSTLIKCSWWTRAGDFAIWEGLGCCGFHTTDITYQGSFNILALFPDLQKKQMEMGARFQREDGRVHHFFTPDLSQVDNGFDRVDMNQQFVLLVGRDYLWTGDRGYIERLWPHIVSALENTAQLDADGDGLPDTDTIRNTYDGWNFQGTPAYIASLWLSSLLAGVRIAEDLGHRKEARRWKDLLKRGAENFDRKMWNGEYYSLWVDGDLRDECCMADQVDGDWFSGVVGLGTALPGERLVEALRAVMKYNYSEANGLQNAAYPPGVARRLCTSGNVQQQAPWTGIEYAIASMMIDLGMYAEGLRVVENIHDRYLTAGRFWNHVECGDHYYRAMSSWAVLLAATGFKIDAPRDTLTLAPPVPLPVLTAPWVSSSGWGRFEAASDHLTIDCLAGRLGFSRLATALEGGPFEVLRNGRAIEAKAAGEKGSTAFQLSRAVVLRPGDRLEVRAKD